MNNWQYSHTCSTALDISSLRLFTADARLYKPTVQTNQCRNIDRQKLRKFVSRCLGRCAGRDDRLHEDIDRLWLSRRDQIRCHHLFHNAPQITQGGSLFSQCYCIGVLWTFQFSSVNSIENNRPTCTQAEKTMLREYEDNHQLKSSLVGLLWLMCR